MTESQLRERLAVHYDAFEIVMWLMLPQDQPQEVGRGGAGHGHLKAVLIARA